MASAPPTTLPDVRSDFPVLSREWNGQRVTYVDSAATSQKPNQVLVAMDRFLRESNASVHRGLYEQSGFFAPGCAARAEAALRRAGWHLLARDGAISSWKRP